MATRCTAPPSCCLRFGHIVGVLVCVLQRVCLRAACGALPGGEHGLLQASPRAPCVLCVLLAGWPASAAGPTP